MTLQKPEGKEDEDEIAKPDRKRRRNRNGGNKMVMKLSKKVAASKLRRIADRKRPQPPKGSLADRAAKSKSNSRRRVNPFSRTEEERERERSGKRRSRSGNNKIRHPKHVSGWSIHLLFLIIIITIHFNHQFLINIIPILNYSTIK